MINFAERLRQARILNGWRLEECSARRGDGLRQLSTCKYESGEMQPTQENLFALCRALGISTDYFYRRLSVTVKDVDFRKLDIDSAGMQEKIIARTRDSVERYLELEEILNISAKF